MSKVNIFILVLLFFASLQTFAGNKVLEGSHDNEQYYFVLNDQWNDVHGGWGELKYDLAWDEDYHELSGSAAGIEERFEINKNIGQVYATVACGWVTLSYSQAELARVSGDFCNQKIDKVFENKSSMHAWIKNSVLDEIVKEFPNPTQGEIKDFFLSRIKF